MSDKHDLLHIPCVTEYDTKAELYKTMSQQEKIKKYREHTRNNLKNGKVIWIPLEHNSKKTSDKHAGVNKTIKQKGNKTITTTKNSNDWLFSLKKAKHLSEQPPKKQEPEEKQTVKKISYVQRTINDYSSCKDKLIIDHSKWCGKIKQSNGDYNKGIVHSVFDVVEYYYNKACGISNAPQIIIGKNGYEYVKNEYLIHHIKDISCNYSEFMGIFNNEKMTFIFNNDVITCDLVDVKKGINEQIYCIKGTGYNSNEIPALLNLSDNATVYFLKNKTRAQEIDEQTKKLQQLSDPILEETGGIQFDIDYTTDKAKMLGNVNYYTVLESISQIGLSPLLFDTDDVKQYRVSNYKRVMATLDTIRAFLYEGNIILSTLTYFQDIESIPSGILLTPLDKSFVKPRLGKINLSLVGFDDKKELFKAKGTKGNKWGIDGYIYIPYIYLTTGFLDNFWIIDM
jgi:hypothetical protein